jgi:probable HAF family extracellular repeat protein
MCLTLIATSAVVIGLAWAAAPATSPAVKLAAAAKPAGNTAPGTASPGRTAGFVLDHGRYLPVAPPRGLGDLVSSPLGPVGINDRGQVVGEYQVADGTFHGYLWERGRFRTLPTPGGATGINNRGQVTGVTGDVTTTDGYLLDGNRLTTFGAPGAQITIPYDINDRGQIVGGSLTSLADTAPSGFLRSGGWFIVINRPGAVATVLFGINDRGQIAGVGPTAEDLASLPGADMMP